MNSILNLLIPVRISSDFVVFYYYLMDMVDTVW